MLLIVAIALVRFLPAFRGPAYAVFGFALWVALFMAGIHPTLAGVAVALLIPVFTPSGGRWSRRSNWPGLFGSRRTRVRQGDIPRSARSISINDRLRTQVGPFVSFIVLPLFALANAGVRLDHKRCPRPLRSPLTWGVVAGLVVGKLIGITAATATMTATGKGRTGAGADTAPDNRRCCAVRNRFHHCAFHRRPRDR